MLIKKDTLANSTNSQSTKKQETKKIYEITKVFNKKKLSYSKKIITILMRLHQTQRREENPIKRRERFLLLF